MERLSIQAKQRLLYMIAEDSLVMNIEGGKADAARTDTASGQFVGASGSS